MLTRPGYKMTEIGEIPEDWNMKKLGGSVSLKNGINFDKGAKGDIGISVIDVLNMYGESIYVDTSHLYKINRTIGSEYLLKKGDILIVRSSLKKEGVGWTSLSPGASFPLTFVAFIIRARITDSKISPEFMVYFLRSNASRRYLEANAGQVAITNISQDVIRGLAFPLIPKQEQQKIAEILTTADRKIELIDKEIVATEKLKKGLMQTLLTRGIGHTRFKMTEIGEIPEDWHVNSLSELVSDLIGGGTPSTSVSSFWNGDIPWTRGAALTNHYLNKGERYITRKGFDKSAAKMIPAGNVLLATRVSVGNASINTVDMAISQDVTGLVLRRDLIVNDYLYWNCKKLSSQIQRMVQGSTIKGILKSDLSRMKLAIPSLIEQEKIAKIISTVDNKLVILRSKREKSELLRTGLMQGLLTGQVRVKIGPSKGEN